MFKMFKKEKKKNDIEKDIRKIEENTKKVSSINDTMFSMSKDFLSTSNAMLKMFD